MKIKEMLHVDPIDSLLKLQKELSNKGKKKSEQQNNHKHKKGVKNNGIL